MTLRRPGLRLRGSFAGLLAMGIALGGCAGPIASEDAATPEAPSPSATSPAESTVPPPSASPPSTAPTPAGAPADTDVITVPAAGLAIPIPRGWEIVDEAALGDSTVRADLTARYPGIEGLFGAFDGMGERAVPALLAVDPSSVTQDASMATSLSMVVAQPPVQGFLLDMVSGFIETGVSDALGMTAEADRSRVELAAGEAVRLRFPGQGMDPVEAVVWVVGAPAGTVLVSAVGAPAALEALDPDAIVAAMRPSDEAAP